MVGPLAGVQREPVVVVGGAVVVVVAVEVVADGVVVEVGREVRAVKRIGGAELLVDVAPAVVVEVLVGVVADAVTVTVGALVGVLWERVLGVYHPITVGVRVEGIADAVGIGVLRHAHVVVRIGAAQVLHAVVPAVAVGVERVELDGHVVVRAVVVGERATPVTHADHVDVVAVVAVLHGDVVTRHLVAVVGRGDGVEGQRVAVGAVEVQQHPDGVPGVVVLDLVVLDADLVAVVGGHIEGVPVGRVDAAVVPAGELQRVVGCHVVVVVHVHRIGPPRPSVEAGSGVVLNASFQFAERQELEVQGVGQVDHPVRVYP